MKKSSQKLPTLLVMVLVLSFIHLSIVNANPKNMTTNSKERIGLLVILKAQAGKEEAVKKFLLSGLDLVENEPETLSWYAFQIDERTFGIFDTFENEAGRQAHLSGEVAKALLANADDLLQDFDVHTTIQPVDLLANKKQEGKEKLGLLVMMQAQQGKSKAVESFLNAGKTLVEDEPKTISWYAIALGNDTYAIFDTFADESGREAHLNGEVAKALGEQAPAILKDFTPSAIQKINLLAVK
ncbi:MAG: putative quinol monooxygenase [Thermonemataceae bacterium]